jgi:hypothetical protein
VEYFCFWGGDSTTPLDEIVALLKKCCTNTTLYLPTPCYAPDHLFEDHQYQCQGYDD